MASDANFYIEQNERKISGDNEKHKVNDIIRHSVFGTGKIIGMNDELSSYIIQFENVETTRNISYRIQMELVD